MSDDEGRPSLSGVGACLLVAAACVIVVVGTLVIAGVLWGVSHR